MQISVDLSLYPLQDDYIPVIIDFIHRVQRTRASRSCATR